MIIGALLGAWLLGGIAAALAELMFRLLVAIPAFFTGFALVIVLGIVGASVLGLKEPSVILEGGFWAAFGGIGTVLGSIVGVLFGLAAIVVQDLSIMFQTAVLGGLLVTASILMEVTQLLEFVVAPLVLGITTIMGFSFQKTD